MEMRPHRGVPGATHRFLSAAARREFVRFPFGYGRTYSSFGFAAVPNASAATTTDDLLRRWNASFVGPAPGLPTFGVRVSNTGKVRSDVAILGFITRETTVAGADPPARDLFGFSRVGAPRSLTTVDERGVETLRAGTFSVALGGEPDGFAAGELVVTGETKVVYRLPLE
eukprot:gene13730-13470_t